MKNIKIQLLNCDLFLQNCKKNIPFKNGYYFRSKYVRTIQMVDDDTFAKKLRVFPNRVQKSFLNM